MKLILYYSCGLALAWMGVNSVMVGLAYWDSVDGALAPIVLGILILFFAARFIVRTVRMYVPPDRGDSHGLED
ncbi:hypothetical protein C4J81_02425 [Deltaproteobacteria bacterium Smac51]|nr:hypothetical protein C4J81_02425 [Deltaproteobacteria bacterium Smac51]